MKIALIVIAIMPFAIWIASELYDRKRLRIVAVCMWTCVLGFIIHEEYTIIQRIQWHNGATIKEIEKQLQDNNPQIVLESIECYHNVFDETRSWGLALQALNNHLKDNNFPPSQNTDPNPQTGQK